MIVATGFGPDNSIYRELQVHECYAVARADEARGGAARARTRPIASRRRRSASKRSRVRSRDFFLVGHKSYGRTSHFLLETGYRQVADVIAKLAREQAVATPS